MRIFWIVISIIFGVLGIVFTILPMGTIAFLPASIAFLAALIAFLISEKNKRKFSCLLLIISVLILVAIGGKKNIQKDTVKVEQQFILQKEELEKEAQKELEDLENLK